jgi:ferritin-like metal-binding protein YciE
MKWFGGSELNTLDDLLYLELEDLYDAENRLVAALPKMAEAAQSPMLKQAFQTHLGQTRRQVSRLEQVFRQLGKEPERSTCDAMKGLISEGEEIIDSSGDADVRDAALIGAAQKVEHYEIAGYGTARTHAEHLGLQGAVSLLQATLEEESETDMELTRIAEQAVNLRAQHA